MDSAGTFEAHEVDLHGHRAVYRAAGSGPGPEDFIPTPAALHALGDVGHEWLGLAWYWLSGRI